MMNRFFIAVFVALFLTGGAGAPGFAAEKAKTAPQIELLDTAMLKKLVTQGKASAQNEILSQLIGTWDFDLAFWTKKGAAPQLSTGYAVNEMIFDDRFLSTRMNVIFNLGGQNIPYKNLGYIGYDTAQKMFTSVWLDAAHTGMTSGSGKYDAAQKTLEQKGGFTFPTLEKERKYRWVLAFAGSESYKVTVYLTTDAGQEYKTMEMKFHRRY